MLIFQKTSAFTIYQHEYGITTAKSKMPILGTFGAGPCVILALYDDKNKIATLAHIDAVTEIKSLVNIFRHFETQSTVAHLYGGALFSLNECLDIIEFIRNSGIKIENCALVEYSNGPASLAIDARNGRLYSLIKPSDLTPCENFKAKLEQLGESVTHSRSTPLIKGYDGLCEVDLVNENVDLPEAQPLTPGWDMTLSGPGPSNIDPPMITSSYSLWTHAKMANQTTGVVNLRFAF